MASQFHSIYGLEKLPVQACQMVWLCMTDTWITRIISNPLGLVEAKVISINAGLPPSLPYNNQTLCCSNPTTCCTTSTSCPPAGCAPTSVCPSDPRLKYKMSVFYVEIDDSQFDNDPATGLPYVPVCTDFVDINPYYCLNKRIIDALTP